MMYPHCISPFFFFNDTATTEIYTLSLHDALPISSNCWTECDPRVRQEKGSFRGVSLSLVRLASLRSASRSFRRSEDHTSELQSRLHLVCRLLLEKKKNILVTGS